jgi:hypothetical protein
MNLLRKFCNTFLVVSSLVSAHAKETLGILGIEVKGLNIEADIVTNITRNELDKLNKYEVMDKHDMTFILKKDNPQWTECYGRQCLVEAGRTLKADKMLTGSLELYGSAIVVNLRLLDVMTGTNEKSIVQEYLELRNQVPAMLAMTLKKMFDAPVDQELFNKLTKKFDYENLVNNPEATKVNLSGPRMGFTMFTGEYSRILKDKKVNGGFNMNPLMFQFGYQYEVQYLNEGHIQALLEFVPMITGLDQGRFIPSLSLMNGLRSNVYGWELAFGPVVQFVQQSEGYYDNAGKWQINELNPDIPREFRADSRGATKLVGKFVVAVGKTFKSGRLNMPVNLYVVPGYNNSGHQFGISWGFNARR